MTQCICLNVNLSYSQLNKLKSIMKNETEVTLRLSSNMKGNSDDETNFPHKLLLTNRQVANLCKAFTNYLSIDIKLSETRLSKVIQSGGFLSRLLAVTKKRITTNEKCFSTISSKCFNSIRINSSSISSRYRNT